MEVIWRVFRSAGIDGREHDGRIHGTMELKNVALHVVAWARPLDLAKVVLRLPLKVPKERLGLVGEFLHRLNSDARRKYWEMDFDIGEIRLSCFIDTLCGPLLESHFEALLKSLTSAADAVIPHIVPVLRGQLPPDIAARNAGEAIQAGWGMEDGGDDARGVRASAS